MIRLIDVYDCMMQDSLTEGSMMGVEMLPTEEVLYDLLKERDPVANISHKEMPTVIEHCAFVRCMPYLHWYLIQDWGEVPAWVGSIYISKEREIGISIFKKHQGKSYGTVAMKELMDKHPGKLYANISPDNQKSIEFFKRFGAKHIQNTYVIGS